MDSGTSEIRNRKNPSKNSKRNKISEFGSVTEKREKGDGEDSPPVVKNDDTCPQTKSDLNSKRVQSNLDKKLFKINVELDLISISLFIGAFLLRIYRIREPNHIVFDELHYGKYVSLYMKRTFFFDSHPPLGKQLIAAAAYIAGFDGNFKFTRIGSPYTSNVPLFTLRFVPALCGSLLVPTIYHLLLEAGLKQSTAVLAGLLILCDNALLTQSRFILMEPMLILFSVFGILCILKFRKHHDQPYSVPWFLWLIFACISLTCALCVKYVGFFSCCLGLAILVRDFWKMLGCPKYSDFSLLLRSIVMSLIIVMIPVAVYLGVFYVHLEILNRAGPHDSVMTSAFQASLEGGLASITKGQPLIISHGSQITLRHTHGRTCWLHSHPHVYPVRYPDKRGSSHQQQVTCYSFKDVNNWWIVKRPDKNDLVVSDGVDAIKHGDIVQLVHGITSRALNSHDVASPMSPQCQEVSCYIDYNVSMPAQNLWKVDIVNREQHGDIWHTIQSHVRLIHVNSSQALRYSGRQLPDWGFNQHEVVTDKIINQDDTIWNVEEHRYTKTEDQKERERQLVNAEMIPTAATKLSFWAKLFELQYKMLISSGSSTSIEQAHMYSSEPSEWPFMTRGIAYWVSTESNAQVHLLGNIIIWYSATISIFVYGALLVFYLLRRRRHCYDLPSEVWTQFVLLGDVFFAGYLFHYIPYFFLERTLFLHHYLPAFIFKVLLLASLSEHVHYLIKNVLVFKAIASLFNFAVLIWIGYIFYVFKKFIPLCYGIHDLTTNDILNLRWKDTWDFIIHRN